MVLENVALTGANGMTGRAIYQYLKAQNKTVLPLGRRALNWDMGPEKIVKLDLVDWHDFVFLDEVFQDSEVIVHCGAFVPQSKEDQHNIQRMFDVNVRACLNLGLYALERGLPLILISGSTVYAPPHDEAVLETHPSGVSDFGGYYGYTKYLAESVLLPLQDQGLKLGTLRPSSIYGMGLGSEKLVSRLLNQARAGEAITLFPPVDLSLNLIHAQDVARAVEAVLKNQAWQVYNLDGPEKMTIKEFAQCCVEVCKSGSVVCADGNEGAQPKSIELNCNKIQNELSFQPIVDIQNGLKQILMGRYMMENI